MLKENELSTENPSTREDYSSLEWIKLRTEVDAQPDKYEGPWQKLKRKTAENPFIPLGLFMTTCFLGAGLHSMFTGRTRRSQLMMRGRVLAQSFTVIALVSGFGLAATKMKPPSKET